MTKRHEEQAERRAIQRIQQALDRQHNATIFAVTVGVVAGVAVATGIAVWVLSRARSTVVITTDDPEAPLFV